ncbi:MAG: hypothetical protein ACFFDX_13205, partial [Candidatus Odinarchaeota archaeon]
DVPEIQQKPVMKGRVGTHSRKCLGFAITSLAIAGIGFYVAFFVYMFSRMGILDPKMIMIRRIIGWTVIASIFLVGLLFGSSSRTHSKHAKKLEPVNTVEKVGSALGIVGVIINAIAMGIFFVLLLMNFSVYLV